MSTRSLLLALLCTLGPASAASLPSTNSVAPMSGTWRFFRGTNEASLPDITEWRGTNFNDAAFTVAAAPFWYGDARPGGTPLLDMQGATPANYTCFFLRRTFVVTNAAEIGALKLDYFIDDGFVAWINGVEVFREGVSGEPTISTLAANQPIDPAPTVSMNRYPVTGLLHSGTNWLAVQVFNTSTNSSDSGFDCALSTIIGEDVRPTITSFSPAAGGLTVLTQITVNFSEPVTGVSADNLLIAGLGATAVSGGGASYNFTFAPAPYGNVPITWAVNHTIMDLSLPPNPFDGTAPGATWSYSYSDVVPPVMAARFPQPEGTVRSLGQIEVAFSESVTGVGLGDLLINGQPGTNLVTELSSYVFQFPQPLPGPVEVLWIGGHGITDLASSPNAFAGGAWSYTLDPNATGNDLVISEINAANQSGLLDEGGAAQDWIEIHNQGVTSADLDGWSLTDDAAVPALWVFPARVLLPNEYLVVFASGKDIKTPAGTNRFHTNFKLSSGGEFLGLFTPDSPRQLAGGFAPEYPGQRMDHSYGFDQQSQLRYFATPTPGAVNGLSTITGVVQPVHFSSARGHYTQPFHLVLSCATPAATIRYTTDGSEPTAASGTLYSAPLRVTNTLFLRAAAFRANLLPSPVASHSFFFNLTAAERSLPTLSILTHSNSITGTNGITGMFPPTRGADTVFAPVNPGDYFNPTKTGLAWERPVSIELIYSNDNSGFQIDAGLRVQGSDWTRPRYQSTSKFSYRFYFRGDYGSGRLEYPIFPTAGVQSFDQIVHRAGHNDETNPFLTDELMRQLAADTGQAAPHGEFVHYWLNGVFKRYYNPCERVAEGFLQSWHGGGTSWDIITVGGAIQGGTNTEWNSLRSYVANQNVQTPAVYTEIARRMDLVNFIEYLLVNSYGATWDWPHNNWRAARERAPGGKFRWYVWDAEGAFAQNGGAGRAPTAYDTIQTDLVNATSGQSELGLLYQRLRNSPEFRLLWADRVHKQFFNNGALGDSNITTRYLEMKTRLLPAITGAGLTFNDSILTGWISQRRTPLLNQYNTHGLLASSNAPVFSQHGGRVAPGFGLAMSSAYPGTIYYTTDGGDPRVMFTGAVSNSATAYAGPVTLSQGVLVKARTLNDTNWSALTEAVFDVGTRGVPVRLSEIHYNPRLPDDSRHEFIELQNISGAPVDLAGMYFDEGIAFTFPVGASVAGGARLVLASNTDSNAFAARYPGVAVTGYFSGSLNNTGERLTFRDRAGNIIFSVDYDDGGGWPTAADGGGRSLEILNLYGDPDDPANWRASTANGGTPGAASAPPPTPDVRLNEILAANVSALNHGGTFPDFVELHNAGVSSVNLGGWSLSDDGNARKYVLPSTTLTAGGYLIVWLDAATNTTPGLHADFSLDAAGDTLSLYDAATNRVDAVSLGLQLPNYSVGRVGGSWTLTTPSTNAPNVAAPTAPASNLSVNEWVANPLPGADDWIEIYNRAALPVALRGLYLATTGAVHQITSLSFIGPLGFVQFLADEGVGARHLDFKLPAAGDSIIIYDDTGAEVERVSYTSAVEGVAGGRLPDGTGTFSNFSPPGSPGTNNFVVTYTGPVLNEVLARNQGAVVNGGRYADFLELFNPNGTDIPLAGMSLSVDGIEPGQWSFPAGAGIAGNGYIVVWCDGGRAASTTPGDYNTGRWLDGESGGAYLFNTAGQLVNSVEYGHQVADKSIGLSAGQWRLLSAPSAGVLNSAAAALGSSNVVRVNEWMANPVSGTDWFELFNGTNLPVSIGGLVLTDDPSMVGLNQFRAPPLSFIGPLGFAKFVADGQAGDGRNHVSFSLDGLGDSLQIYSTNGAAFTLIDAVSFGAQFLGVSQGRLPDGGAGLAGFSGSASPSAPNYALLPDVVINEILTHTDPPLQDAVELRNTSPNAVNIGGWFLSDSEDNFKKHRIPDGTMLAGGSVLAFDASQFDTGPNAFNFNSAHGEEIWLSAADALGVLTGSRVGVKFNAAANGVSFGRYPTSLGVDYPALSARTLGTANAAPLLGPVIINEIMYHAATSTNGGEDEFIELLNVTAAPVPLFDPANPANTWRLEGVGFTFPPNFTLGAGSNLVVVNFDPGNAVALAAFRSLYSVPATVPVLGPYSGKLDNGGETVELQKPDPPQPGGNPDAGFVPYITVDRVSYADSPPWPSGAVDGGGLSLQRKTPSSYGNEPLHWVASAPTAGAANSVTVAPPVVTASPQDLSVPEGVSAIMSVSADGTGPLGYQWRFNGNNLPEETNSSFGLGYTAVEDTGLYDVIVSNPGGSAMSAAARLLVLVPPTILLAPVSQLVSTGATVTFNIAVRATPPITYQWRLNGVNLPGETAPSILRTNVSVADDGVYDVLVSSPAGMIIASATLGVKILPLIPIPPLSQTVVAGGNVSLSAVMSGNPAPHTFSWRRISPSTVLTQVVSSLRTNFVTINTTAAGLVLSNGLTSSNINCRLVVSNAAAFPAQGAAVNFTITVLADSDADGTSDLWSQQYFGHPTGQAGNLSRAGDDFDHDGMSNGAEFIAGTNPTNSLSFLGVGLAAGPSSAVVSFGAISNRTYTMQFTDAPGQTPWFPLADVLARTTNRVEIIPDPNWTPHRFYRVTTPRQP